MRSTPLQERRLRVRLIRRRVVGAATAIFLATTGGILVQLLSGHDPALARGSHTTTTHASTTTTHASPATTHASTSSQSTTSGSSPSSSSSNYGSADSSSSGSVTPLTTSAS